MDQEEIVSEEVLEAMGVTRPVYEEVQLIVGHLPTVDELSTLLAMYAGSGRQTGLLTWLKGQFHAAEAHDYLYTGESKLHKSLHEPKVKECLEIARKMWGKDSAAESVGTSQGNTFKDTGLCLYLVGDISTEFLDSEYARKYLHIVDDPIEMGDEEGDRQYRLMILEALKENGALLSMAEVGKGGVFQTLLAAALPEGLGFDILTCREIRLDAFLFGEEKGRFLVSLPEEQDDFFLLKMDEAKVNCCFLGRTTKGRILVDGMDFGPVTDYIL